MPEVDVPDDNVLNRGRLFDRRDERPIQSVKARFTDVGVVHEPVRRADGKNVQDGERDRSSDHDNQAALILSLAAHGPDSTRPRIENASFTAWADSGRGLKSWAAAPRAMEAIDFGAVGDPYQIQLPGRK
jgi:hypothetical protein